MIKQGKLLLSMVRAKLLLRHCFDIIKIKLVCIWFLGMCSFSTNVFALVELTEVEKEWIRATPVVRLCTHTDYEPLEFKKKGIHTGVTSEYYELIAKNTGLKFKLVKNKHWNDCLQMLKNKQVDVISITKKTPERSKYLNFTGQLIDDDVVIVTRQSNRMFGEVDIDDLKGKKVAVVAGYFYEELLAKEYPKINIIKVKSTKEGMLAVAFGKADALFSNLPVVSYQTHEFGIDNLQVSGMTPYKTDYRAGIRKDLTVLPDIIQKGFDEISPSTKRNIFHRWIKLNYYQPWYNKKIVTWLVLGGLGLLLLTLFWGFLLKRQVAIRTREYKQKIREESSKLQETQEALDNVRRELWHVADMDKVTHLPRMRCFEKDFKFFSDKEIHAKQPVAVYQIAIDEFANYIDKNGVEAGNKVLKKIATALLKNINENKLLSRNGLSEFSMLLFDIDKLEAETVAQSINLIVQELDLPFVTAMHGHITVKVATVWCDQLNHSDYVKTLSQLQLLIQNAEVNSFILQKLHR